MYRDDPLDDEVELRAVVGDAAVDHLDDVTGSLDGDAVAAAVDVLRVLQGWVDDAAAGRWFHARQRRLGGVTPLAALARGAFDDVEDAARAWAAANG